MHFTSTGVFWECQSQVANEAFTNGFPRSLPRPAGIARFSGLKRFLSSNLPPPSVAIWNVDLHKAWVDFVVHYSGCGLTIEADRLIAINGIAQDIARLTNDTFVCGLWRSNLTRHLLWQRSTHQFKKPFSWHAPTWSWATLGAPIIYHCFWERDPYTRMRDYANLVSFDLNVRASGQVTGASLDLRGKSVDATLSIRSEHELKEGKADIYYGTEETPNFIFASLDDMAISLPYEQCVLLMAILGYHHGEEDVPQISYALILEPCDGEFGEGRVKYRRIGLCRMNQKIYEHYHPNESFEEHVITII